MYLLEHDAKTLAAGFAIPSPPGCLIGEALPPGPWVVKAQVAAGGRGKAGAIRKAATMAELDSHARAIGAMSVRGQRVRGVRVEQDVGPAQEAYVALLLDPAAGAVRVLMAEQGGVEIEQQTAVRAERAPLDGIEAAVRRVGAGLAPALTEAGLALAAMFRACEAVLIEINPLFVRADGSWLAGDLKLITDDNALYRQPALRALVERNAAAYPEVRLKLEHGFDYVVVDEAGDIGLLTTGAGLSMMLIDELRARGLRPYNFLDVRTGGMRGDPARLIRVLEWIADGPNVRVVLVNIFAGITHLGEFARLLVQARAAVPRLAVPFVVRLVGTAFEEAEQVLGAAGIPVTTDLEQAVAKL
ncbi:MAG TPA: ATP-grasp domain-containing protein [Candidatus Sulfotelmatobacter sp.]|nr:ATP-grasp domain-containing protein [Candidatus Sulfotelmatobacter sp.]